MVGFSALVPCFSIGLGHGGYRCSIKPEARDETLERIHCFRPARALFSPRTDCHCRYIYIGLYGWTGIIR